MEKITFEQALETLYNATRKLNLNAQDHEVLKQCAEKIIGNWKEKIKEIEDMKKSKEQNPDH